MHRYFKTLGSILPSIALMAILALAFLSIPAKAPTETYDKFGPRVDDILIKIYQGRDQEFLALQSGDIDIIDWPLDYNTYTTLLSQPSKYTVYPLTMYDMYNLEMNNLKWPTSDVNVRRAIAYLIDKQTFFTMQLKSFSGSLMDTPIAKEWTYWYNDFTAKYVYNPTKARQILDAAGYQDYDSDGKREYRNATGTYELPPLEFYIRNDDPDRMHLGQDYIVPELLAAGLPVNAHIAPKQTCWTAVMTYPYNYHLYTGGWGPYTDPDYLYDQYDSKFGIDWYNARRSWANNYVFFTNATFDYWAEQLKYAPTKADAVTPAMKSQEILMDQVPMVPVWHSAGALASRANYGHWSGEERYWDKPWTGMVNQRFIHGMSTSGLNGYWTFLNAHPQDWERGGVIRYGFMTGADVFNPVHADFYWDWEVLNKVYDFLVASNPYTGDDIPWMAKSWTVETWGAPSKTVVKFNLFNNILWHDNLPFTSADVKFTLEYMKAAFSPLFYTYVLDIDHINTPDAYTVEVYYNVQSTFALHWLGTVPMIPKHIWENIDPANSRNGGEFETTAKLTGTGPFRFVSKTLQEIHLTDNPTYFRKLVRPDFYKTGSPIPTHDGDVDIDDFGIAVGHFGDAYSGTWPHAVDQWADVNKDMVVDLDDIMEIGVRFLKTEYYPYVNGYPNYYAP